jgi:hypothetical protein
MYDFKNSVFGLNSKLVSNLFKRLELKNNFIWLKLNFNNLSINQKLTLNSQLTLISPVLINLFTYEKYVLLRYYLIKSFKGRCYVLGKPSNGQRT